MDPVTHGDPNPRFDGRVKAPDNYAAALEEQCHMVGRQKVADLLAALGYSLQANRKTKIGSDDHPDRDRQFHHINEQVMDFTASKGARYFRGHEEKGTAVRVQK